MTLAGLSIELTGVGGVLLLAAGLCLLFRSTWLLPLLVVSAVLHAPAALLVTIGADGPTWGLSPWLLCAGVVMLHWGWLVVSERGLGLAGDLAVRRLVAGWWVYALVVALGAMALPHLATDLMVYSPANRGGADAGLVPLHWTLINAVQGLNVLLYAGLLLYLARTSRRAGFRERLATGFVLAIAISVALLLYQRAVVTYGWPAWLWFQHSLNPSYVQALGYGIDVHRLSWPFSEPSYAGVWFSGVYAGGLALMLLTRRGAVGAACSLAGVTGLLNAFGMAGLGSAAVMTAVIMAMAWLAYVRHARQQQRPLWHLPWLRIVLVAVCLVGAAWVALKVSGLRSPWEIWERLVLPRLHGVGVSGSVRAHANWHALELVRETFGFGVGIGSNRGSSYVLNLLSNVGILPALGFLALLGWQAWLLFTRWREEPLAVFLLWGGAGMFVGITLGISDLNWPAWWIWILSSFALCVREPPSSDSAAPVESGDEETSPS